MTDSKLVSTKFCFEVSNISDLTEVHLQNLIVNGISFGVQIQKNFGENEPLGLYLYCANNDDSKWPQVAASTFKLRSFVKGGKAFERHKPPYVFDRYEQGYGFPSFIIWKELFDADNGFVENDTIKLEIQITLADPYEVNKSELIRENVDKCEKCGTATFRLSVSNIEHLMAVHTERLMLKQIGWYMLVVYKDHSGHLSFYLNNKTERWEDDLTHDSVHTDDCSCKFRISCTLISSNPNASSAMVKTENLKNWNFIYLDKLILWSELLKPENGYVENGSIVIEVELKIIKSEDAATQNDSNNNAAKDDEKLLKLECMFCFEGLANKEILSVPCGHLYCSACITEAIISNKKCSVCNFPAELTDLRRIQLKT